MWTGAGPILKPFAVLLVSARGEIACRIIRTARRLGMRTVAVYSDADRGSLHVRSADSAHRIGGPLPTESYLHTARILEAAVASGAGAIHPGYGFLSENPEFAQACAEKDLVFVGPSAEVIRTMGSKSVARATVMGAGVPVVPGYHGSDQSDVGLTRAAADIGFPIMVKPVMGGGGKGMHVVWKPEGFLKAVHTARHEALGAFGDEKLLLEKYIATSRHVEVQVFGDKYGNVVHLHERDCSLQRRHQKIIEEAPAPLLNEEMRAKMHAAAVTTAKQVGYVGAGTVEFIVDTTKAPRPSDIQQSGSNLPYLPFYFLEMNTRLQVEHPVTEEVTGLDLVEWQLRVAAGEHLPLLAQSDIGCSGSAIEARIYAESPEKGFLPQAGPVYAMDFSNCRPASNLDASTRLRVDAGVEGGKDEVSVFYDPMIAKVIAHGSNREAARRRLNHSLSTAILFGPQSNTAFCARVLNIPEFVKGGFDTGMLSRNEKLALSPAVDTFRGLCLIALALRARAARSIAATAPVDIGRNIDQFIGFRLNQPSTLAFKVCTEHEREIEHGITVEGSHGNFRISISTQDTLKLRDGSEPGEVVVKVLEANVIPGRMEVIQLVAEFDDGAVRENATVVVNGNDILLRRSYHQSFEGDANLRAKIPDRKFEMNIEFLEEDSLMARSPMPGRIVKFSVSEGDKVVSGDVLFQVEAMKCLHTVTSRVDGSVFKCNGVAGDIVDTEKVLVELKAKAEQEK